MKKLLIVFGILAVLIAGSYAALSMVLSPARIKTAVLPTVSDVLGREVLIDGDISISLFPTFGLKIEKLYVTNPAGSELEGNLLEVANANLAVAVLPLLKKELEVREFTLIEPNINLVVMKNGDPNWVFSGLQKPTTAQPAAPVEEGVITEATAPTLPLADLRINSIAIKNGTITYSDQMAGSTVQLTKANFDIKMPTLDAVADIAGEALLNGNTIKGNLTLETPYSLIYGENTKLKLDADTPYADIIAEANLVYTAQTTRPVFRADFTQISAAGEGFSTSGTGEFAAVWGNQRPEVTATLDLAFFEITNPQRATRGSLNAPREKAPKEAVEPLTWPTERLDFSAFNNFDGQATLKIDQIKNNGRIFGPLNMGATLVDRRLVLGLKRLDVFDGQTTGEIVLNTRSAVPSASINTHLVGLQIERAMPEEAAPYGASGTIANHVELTTSGHSVKEFMANMNGTVDLTATQVGATKFDLEKTAELHLGALGPIVSNNVSENTIEAIKQKLTTMAFSAVFKEGRGQAVVKFSGPVLAQGGEGVINLPAADISLRMDPLLKANEKRDIILPFYIEGPLNGPELKADQEGITREVARQAARIGAEKLLDKAIKKGDGSLGILGNILQDATNRQDTAPTNEAETTSENPDPVKDLKKALGDLLGK